jgi:hypothetical protein
MCACIYAFGENSLFYKKDKLFGSVDLTAVTVNIISFLDVM